MLTLIHGEEQIGLDFLEHAAVLVAADEHFHLFQPFAHFGGFEDVRQLLMLRHAELDLQQFGDRSVDLVFGSILTAEHGAGFLDQPPAKQVLPLIKIGDRRFERFELVG